MTPAEAEALGLVGNDSVASAGAVGFSSSFAFGYASGTAPPSSASYFIGVVEHEITEDMGRASLLNATSSGGTSGGPPTYYSPIDLFRYAGSGTPQVGTGAPSYFSIDHGATNLDNWNNFVTGDTGDLADWAPTAGFDPLRDGSPSGVVNPFTTTDQIRMNELGWSGSPPPPARFPARP